MIPYNQQYWSPNKGLSPMVIYLVTVHTKVGQIILILCANLVIMGNLNKLVEIGKDIA